MSGARAGAVAAAGLGGVALAAFLASRGVEPVATWAYLFVWYPLLLAVEGGIALRHGSFLLIGRPGALLSVVGWSAPLWFVFELLNLRLENWYYVFVPEHRPAFWAGVVASFATVIPACILPASLLHPRKAARGRGVDGAGREPGAGGEASAPAKSVLRATRLLGGVFLLLPLLEPRWFFPLVWGAFALLAESDTARNAPDRSLLLDVRRGRWERIGSLLAGGALAGLCWESLNTVARARWIYTVPGLEELKVFEMPLLGFLGFPPLAITAYAVYQWLAARGWAVQVELVPEGFGFGRGGGAGRRERASGFGVAVACAVAISGTALVTMEERTVSSRTPRLRDLPGLLPGDAEDLAAWGLGSVFDLAEAEPEEVAARVPGVEEEEARAWIATARLATTRGMGTRYARFLHGWGVTSPEALARTDPDDLARCFASVPEADPLAAQVRVWWRGAVRQAAGGEGGRVPGADGEHAGVGEAAAGPACPPGTGFRRAPPRPRG